MLLLASSLATGAYSSRLIPSEFFGAILVLGAVSFISLIACVCFRWNFLVSVAFAVIASFAIGASASIHAQNSVGLEGISPDSSISCVCEGIVAGVPQRRQKGCSADIDLKSCECRGVVPSSASGRARFFASRAKVAPDEGDRVRFRCRFFDSDENDNPGKFEYGRFLASRGIGATGIIYGQFEVIGEDSSILQRAINWARNNIAASIPTSISEERRGVIEAVALGKKDLFSGDLRREFSAAGISHIFAISGLHVGLVSAFIFFLIKISIGRISFLLLCMPVQRIAALATLPAIWSYVVITGYSISSIRAGIMITVYLFGMLVGRRQDLLNTLAIAVALILLIMPLSLFDISFQLSVTAVLGIAIFARRFEIFLKARCVGFFKSRWARRIASSLISTSSVTAAATIAVSPLVAYHFKIVTLLGFFTNIVAIPVAAFALVPAAFIASLVALFSQWLAAVIWHLVAIPAGALLSISNFSAEHGSWGILNFAPTALELSLLYLFLISISASDILKGRSMRFILPAFFALLLLGDALYWRVLPLFETRLRIYFFDVGEGQSALLRLPGGSDILVDGGGNSGENFDIGERIVAPALWSMGVHRLSAIVVTAPKVTRFKGLRYMIENFSPEEIIVGSASGPDADGAEFSSFLQWIKSEGNALKVLPAEVTREIRSGVGFEFINQMRDFGARRGEYSISLNIIHDEVNILMQGDSARAPVPSNALLFAASMGKYDVEKIERSIQRLDPDYVILSDERPRWVRPFVKDSWRYPEGIIKTDRDGMVEAVSDGSDISLRFPMRRSASRPVPFQRSRG